MRIESRRQADGLYVGEIRHQDPDVFYVTDPCTDEDSALQAARVWIDWFENVPLGRTESIYYILAVPETWPGLPTGAHSYSGLHFKIGRAKHVNKRLQNLQTGTSSKLILHALEPGNVKLERVRHEQFATERRQGEWFSCSPHLVRHVFDTWKRHRELPPKHQGEIMMLMDRIEILRSIMRCSVPLLT